MINIRTTQAVSLLALLEQINLAAFQSSGALMSSHADDVRFIIAACRDACADLQATNPGLYRSLRDGS